MGQSVSGLFSVSMIVGLLVLLVGHGVLYLVRKRGLHMGM